MLVMWLRVMDCDTTFSDSFVADNVEKMIREDGLLNVMKTNVADRRRVQKQNPAFREVSMFIFTQENP